MPPTSRLSTSCLTQRCRVSVHPFFSHVPHAFPLFQEDPKLWYGIGILYDRYGSLDHAEEAFASVLRMDKGQSSSIVWISRAYQVLISS